MSLPFNAVRTKDHPSNKTSSFWEGVQESKQIRKLCQQNFSVPKINVPPISVFEKTIPDQQAREVFKRAHKSSLVSRAHAQTSSNFHKALEETTAGSRGEGPTSPNNKTVTDFQINSNVVRIRNFSLTGTRFGIETAKASKDEPTSTKRPEGEDSRHPRLDPKARKGMAQTATSGFGSKKRTLTGEGLYSRDSQSKLYTLGTLFGKFEGEGSAPAATRAVNRKPDQTPDSKMQNHKPRKSLVDNKSESSYLEDLEQQEVLPKPQPSSFKRATVATMHENPQATTAQRPFWYSQSLAKMKANKTFQKKGSQPVTHAQVANQRVSTLGESMTTLPERPVVWAQYTAQGALHKPYRVSRMSLKGNKSTVSLRSLNHHFMSYPKLDLLEQVISTSQGGASSDGVPVGFDTAGKDFRSLYSTTQPNAPMPSLNLDHFRHDLSAPYREFLLVLNHQNQLSRTVDLQLTAADSVQFTRFNNAAQLVALASKTNTPGVNVVEVFTSDLPNKKLDPEQALEMIRSGLFRAEEHTYLYDRRLPAQIKKHFDRAKIENLRSEEHT